MMTLVVFLFLFSFSYARPKIYLEGSGSLITFSISNPSPADLSVLKWGTPFEGMRSNIFTVTSPRQQAKPYLGILVKRGAPSQSDYIKVPRHSSVSVTIDLSEYYLLDEVGTYQVSLSLPRFSGSFEVLNRVAFLNVTSNNLSKLKDFNRTQNLLGCSASEESDINAAVTASKPVVLKTRDCMDAHTCDRLSVIWLGKYSQRNYDYVRSVFNEIHHHMQKYPFKSVCHAQECEDNVYAYVYPADPTFTVYLCNMFFELPNERVETIIHELSHFDSLGATDDYAYGRTPCKELALKDPRRACHNADNLCYFASDVSHS